MNKKKVRGWKRQIRKLERWKNQNLNLELNRYGYSYVKIWLDPWYRLEKRNPPIWFQRLILAGLLEIYESWRKQLIIKGEKFYLKIWLFDPHFITSQVVAAVGKRVTYYEDLFAQSNETKAFPYQKYLDGIYNLHDYDWDLSVDEDVYFEREDELSAEDIESLKKIVFRVVESSDGDKMYGVKKGNLWLGARKNV
ncbi:MAG: hypothetical protein QOD75_2820 [Blastocatellia bacterium]|jgi:hypothetical protein|nr:hypothetical protein [Blastocatellia bacterium]